ncbi:hypothetical protein, partial [Mycolicibacterium austroafricanum]|uniref:hypothetical protein n=1 Tax=Mycolicibacterium austroafricanum TaxID=39687 RepID=UPI00197BB5B1
GLFVLARTAELSGDGVQQGIDPPPQLLGRLYAFEARQRPAGRCRASKAYSRPSSCGGGSIPC